MPDFTIKIYTHLLEALKKQNYSFRIVKKSWDEGIIKEIASLDHEIGYHYEEMTTHSGNHQVAFDAFKQNLNQLRKLAKVSTICMHGSPST